MAATVIILAAVRLSAPSVAAEPSGSVVAVLLPGPTYKPVLEGLREGLRQVGLREEANVKFLVEHADGKRESYALAAAKLIEAKPRVILAVTTPCAVAVKAATNIIPIVFVSAGAPIEAGLIAGFASSQNNVTGVSSSAAFLSGKRLELLREIAPWSKQILMIVSANESIGQTSAVEAKKAARKMALHVVRRDVRRFDNMEKLLLEKWSGRAVLLLPGALTGRFVERIIDKAKRERLPLVAYEDTLVKLGALASYGSDRHLTGLQAAKLVANILKGTKPADMPIETPDRFILSVNLATAKAIGLKFPKTVLKRVDRLVE
jgi:putative ABC transport system substrate-binding protein